MQTLASTKKMEITDNILRSFDNYRRMGIDIEVLDEDTVKIAQKQLFNGYMLNQKQLVERVKKVFEGQKIKVVPVVYCLDLSEIDINWVQDMMLEHGIKRKDLIKQMAIDKSSLRSWKIRHQSSYAPGHQSIIFSRYLGSTSRNTCPSKQSS